MNKLLASFMAMFFFAALLSGVAEGEGGVNSTYLVTAATTADTTLTVNSTDGFLHTGTVTIGDEDIYYTKITQQAPYQFQNCTRGYNSTSVVAHSRLSHVYSAQASVLNNVLGFNVPSTAEVVSGIGIPIMLGKFFSVTVPRLVSWDFAYLKTGWMIYLRVFLQCISMGLLITVAIQIASALGGVLQGIFKR